MLENLKLMLGITDNDLDYKLKFIIDSVTGRLKNLIGGLDPPSELDHIILEVSIIRFNRIGSEGLSSHSVEGESLTFNDNDFAAFSDEIQAFLDTQSTNIRGKMRFI